MRVCWQHITLLPPPPLRLALEAVQTFCSQAYGAGRLHLVGLVLQRALLLLSLLAAAVAAAWTQAEPLLLALGQDPAIARGTAQFLLRWGRCRVVQSPLIAWAASIAGVESAKMCCSNPRPPRVLQEESGKRSDAAPQSKTVCRAAPALWFTGVFEALKR